MASLSLAEEASRVHKGSTPTILAGLRNAARVLRQRLELARIVEADHTTVFRPKIAMRLVLGRNGESNGRDPWWRSCKRKK